MTDPSRFSEEEQEELVAFLDQELDETAAQAVEARLNLDPAARTEAESLRKAWDLLDYLPRPDPSPDFTQRTLQSIAPVTGQAPRPRGRLLRILTGLGWVALLFVAALGGYFGFNLAHPREPGDRELLRDLRVIENKRLYESVDDLDFLKELDKPDLFGEEL
jgi:anti-sigma factor RsiW